MVGVVAYHYSVMEAEKRYFKMVPKKHPPYIIMKSRRKVKLYFISIGKSRYLLQWLSTQYISSRNGAVVCSIRYRRRLVLESNNMLECLILEYQVLEKYRPCFGLSTFRNIYFVNWAQKTKTINNISKS